MYGYGLGLGASVTGSLDLQEVPAKHVKSGAMLFRRVLCLIEDAMRRATAAPLILPDLDPKIKIKTLFVGGLRPPTHPHFRSAWRPPFFVGGLRLPTPTI